MLDRSWDVGKLYSKLKPIIGEFKLAFPGP